VLEDRLCLSNYTVVASGLDNPRGLEFGPGGILYVAEGGAGGTNLASGPSQVPPPVGPYSGGHTARISAILPGGLRTTVVDKLPSSQTSKASGGLVSGVADVAFLRGQLYYVLAGAGASHGVPDTPNGLFRVNSDGTTALVADLGAYQAANPVQSPDLGDFEPDGTWYSMVVVGGNVYAAEPNHQEIDKITPDGQVSRLIDMSVAFPGTTGDPTHPSDWVGPTSLTFHGGNFYVGTLGQFPVTPGTQSVYEVTPDGRLSVAASGLTAITGVAFHGDDMYVLETDTVAGLPGQQAAGTGQVVRVTKGGGTQVVATGLTFPTAMTFGPDGGLYVSNFGFGLPPGAGQIWRFDVSGDDSAPRQDSAGAGPAVHLAAARDLTAEGPVAGSGGAAFSSGGGHAALRTPAPSRMPDQAGNPFDGAGPSFVSPTQQGGGKAVAGHDPGAPEVSLLRSVDRHARGGVV
jgi:hypothetical protein